MLASIPAGGTGCAGMKAAVRRQLSVPIENQPGRLGAVARVLADAGIHIDAFSVIDNVEHGMVRLMTSDPGTAAERLRATGMPVVEAAVVAIEMVDRRGNLALLGETLAASGVNIEYAYASTAREGEATTLILKTAYPERAAEALAALPDRA